MKKLAITLLASLTSFGFAAPDVGTSPAATSTSAAGNSFNPTFSADGQHLVFVSHANNLVTNDDLGLWLDVFVRNVVTSNTVLVSVSTNGFGGANADANFPSISSNGQFIAFASRASNLVPGDTNGASDVFVRDMVAGTTRLVSVDVNGTAPTDLVSARNTPLSGKPLISADGRWVFFESRATTMIPAGTISSVMNIYRRDLWSNSTEAVALGPTEFFSAGTWELSSMTPDGRFVALMFSQSSSPGQGTNVFVKDMQTGQTNLVSTNVATLIGTASYRCSSAVLSTDGRYVAFLAAVPTGQNQYVLRHDLQTATTVVISSAATNLSHGIQISADGRYVLFEESDTIYSKVMLWDGQSATATNISCTSNDLARNAVMNPSATRVAFIGCSNLYLRDVTAGTNVLVSASTNGVPSSGDFMFVVPALSPDGNLVAFDGNESDLTVGDVNGASDIFVRNVSAGATELITKAQLSKPAATAFSHSFFGPNSVSADGRFIVSTRYDDPSAYRDTNGWADVFVNDVLSGMSAAASINTVSLVENTNVFANPVISADGSTIVATRYAPNNAQRVYSTSVSNAFAGNGMSLVSQGINVSENGNSFSPSVSSNGLQIVFTSTSSDMVSGVSDNNFAADVILRTSNGLLSATNTLISISLAGNAGNGGSSNGIISSDGRWVVFESTATDLVTNSTAGLRSLFARDLWSNQTHLVSIAPDGNPQWGYVTASAAISGNSRYVAFSSANVYLTLHDLQTHTSVVAENPAARSPALDQSGRFVAFLKQPVGSNFNQVFVRDMLAPQSEMASVGTGGVAANSVCANAVLAGDGRYVIFQTKASNLVNDDTNGMNDIFVRDRLLGVTMLASANAQGRSGNGPSTRPVLAADGRTVVFQSFASDLAAGDYNDKRDVFVLKLGGADTDGDGMDDDWEVAYFGDKSRNGSGDFDGDGASDLQEFLAGTDPKNAGSIFRVLTVTPAGGGGRLLFWTGNPALSYRVEFKDDLSAAGWTALTGAISWNGSTASIIDPTATNSTHRYYRAIRLP